VYTSQPEFRICSLEVLILGPEMDHLQMFFCMFLKQNFLKTVIFLQWKMVFALVLNRFRPAPNTEVPVGGPHLWVQIFQLNILHFRKRWLYFIVLQDKNQMVCWRPDPKFVDYT
jgi:hypothetical protein